VLESANTFVMYPSWTRVKTIHRFKVKRGEEANPLPPCTNYLTALEVAIKLTE